MQQQQHDEEEETKSNQPDIHAILEKFECTVCLEVAKEPVVTECGHLFWYSQFCYKCFFYNQIQLAMHLQSIIVYYLIQKIVINIYFRIVLYFSIMLIWLNQNNEYLVCPNCKNGIKKDQIRPLYARNEDDTHQKQRDQNIPKRTLPVRSNPQRNANHLGGNQPNLFLMQRISSANLSLGVSFAGYGYFPSLYGLLNIESNNQCYLNIKTSNTKIILQISQNVSYFIMIHIHTIIIHFYLIEHVSPEVAKQPLFEKIFWILVILCTAFLLFCI